MPVLQAGKPDTVFPPRWAEYEAVLWAVGWALSVLRVRKPVMVFAPRWAEYGTEIWAVSWVLLWAELLRLFEPRSSPPPRAVGCNSRKLDCAPGGELL